MNVFVTPKGHLTLADFDQSFVDVSQGMREQNCAYEDVSLAVRSGTYPYMSPELLRDFLCLPGQKRDVITPRSDIWSLGLTLLEFALGAALPGEGRTVHRFMLCLF